MRRRDGVMLPSFFGLRVELYIAHSNSMLHVGLWGSLTSISCSNHG